MSSDVARTPRAIWLLILALAALQPLGHVLILYAAPSGTVPTGLQIPDSALFFESMDMFPSAFASPYATCQAEGGPQSITYYNVPHLWLYGALGLLQRLIPLDPFLFYGFASGLGALFYLWVVYRLLRTVVPQWANLTFTLFALGGGPGGALYILCAGLNLQSHPAFETYFFRFAMYDLMEGPHFNPVLYYPRLYYTLSLGACLGGFDALIRCHRAEKGALPWRWLGAIFLGTFLNARYGLFVGGLVVAWLIFEKGNGPNSRRALLAYGAPAAIAFLGASLLMGINPAVVDNVLVVGNMAMWFSPFVFVCALPMAAGMRPLWHRAKSSELRLVRALIPGTLGYLVAYGVAYLMYQANYGNLLSGRDGSVAAVISDGALLGGLAGTWWGWFQPRREAAADGKIAPLPDWIALWFLGYSGLALSGFGQGWFLRFGPQRLQVLLWLPLCIIAARGLVVASPRWRRGITVTIVAFGTTSILVSTLFFQAPLGRSDGAGPWPQLHAEIMAEADRRLLDSLGDGTVLAPAPASDVVVRLRGNPVVFGIGSFNLTDLPFLELREATATFFAPETVESARREILSAWCVEWVYAPHTWPVSAQTVAALDSAPWLEAVAHEGDGALYRVLRETAPQ